MRRNGIPTVARMPALIRFIAVVSWIVAAAGCSNQPAAVTRNSRFNISGRSHLL